MCKKCTSNSYIFTKHVWTVQNLYKMQTEKSLKLEMCVFCTNKRCINYTKPVQVANWNCICLFSVQTQTMYKLYKMHANVNRIICIYQYMFFNMQKLYILYFSNSPISSTNFHYIFPSLQNFRTSFFILKKCTDEFVLYLIYFNFNNHWIF